ncbi:hypothetical protein ACFP2T_34770 [Plantactinospora solaniradicis]|uniref:IS5/IS1182 family transposase n=1 Tax=Plantactinospora solaniradicis TaxID=1723736 RepID=A0ABW1KJQ5_9ACTN
MRCRSSDEHTVIVEFSLYLATVLTVIHRLINKARALYRPPPGPTTRRLR